MKFTLSLFLFCFHFASASEVLLVRRYSHLLNARYVRFEAVIDAQAQRLLRFRFEDLDVGKRNGKLYKLNSYSTDGERWTFEVSLDDNRPARLEIFLNGLTSFYREGVQLWADGKSENKNIPLEKASEYSAEYKLEKLPERIVRRWLFQPALGVSGQSIISIAILDPDHDPVLVEFTRFDVDTSVTHDIRYIVKFWPQGSNFNLKFLAGNSTIDYTLTKQGQLSVGSNSRTGVVRDVDVSQYNFIPGKTDAGLVLEAHATAPVAYLEYFAAKSFKPRRLGELRPSTKREPPRPNGLYLTGRLQGQDAAVESLLAQTNKPTIAEFIKAIGGVPQAGEENPFAELAPKSLKSNIEQRVPRMIVLFEHAFPRAELFALGRDIYLFGDILDAYYMFRGEPGRVRRLPASAPSFTNASVRDVIDFLKTHGFDLDNQDVARRPQIIFDVTSYSHSVNRDSQSSKLMRAAYTYWTNAGRPARDLIPYINFVSTGADGPDIRSGESAARQQTYFNRVQASTDGPASILQIRNRERLQYSDGWHGVYQNFRRDKHDQIVSPPGPPSSRSTRLHMLAELWDVAQVVMNEEFHRRVQTEVCALNLETDL